ncbi:MAG: hypothetical protein R6U55_17445 [Desulfovermiculus sp.]
MNRTNGGDREVNVLSRTASSAHNIFGRDTNPSGKLKLRAFAALTTSIIAP